MNNPFTKCLLPLHSANSKLVNRTVENLCFYNDKKKICVPLPVQSFGKEGERLTLAIFSTQLREAVAEGQYRKLKQTLRTLGTRESRRMAGNKTETMH